MATFFFLFYANFFLIGSIVLCKFLSSLHLLATLTKLANFRICKVRATNITYKEADL